MDLATLKSSAICAVVFAPLVDLDQVLLLRLGQFGLLIGSRPAAFATCIPSRVRERIKSASNSATIANKLNSSLPTGSVGS